MRRTVAADQVDAERAVAARHLLLHPWVTRHDQPEMFTTIVMHRAWLADQFDAYCGWPLHIDTLSGTAKLHKRPARPDPTRGFTTRTGQPWDRRRYALWATVAAELLIRPLQTIADLADTIEALHTAEDLIDFDSGRRPHRLALVDVLHTHIDHGVIPDPVGDLDRYVDTGGDVVLKADQTRIAMLLAAARPPARMPATTQADPPAALRWLATEPRYGPWGDPDTRPTTIPTDETRPDADVRNLYGRHMLARMLLDDPAVETATMDVAVARYATSQEGRRRTHEIADHLGFTFEQHADVQLLVDDTGDATDRTALAPAAAHATQAAGAVLAAVLAGTAPTVADATTVVAHLLDDDPSWATTHQGHPDTLTDLAVTHLIAVGLLRRHGDQLTATAAAHRLDIHIIDTRTTTSSSDGSGIGPAEPTLPLPDGPGDTR